MLVLHDRDGPTSQIKFHVPTVRNSFTHVRELLTCMLIATTGRAVVSPSPDNLEAEKTGRSTGWALMDTRGRLLYRLRGIP